MNSGDGRIFNDQPQDSHSHGVLLQNQPPSAAAEIDEDHSEHDIDQDSAIGSSHGSSFTSVGTSVFERIEEHGRTYHAYKAGKYSLPNDEKEQDRLDLQHAIALELYGSLACAPVDTIPLHNVLDFATGTGLWAIEFAEQNPSAIVIGTDLSAIQPNYVPINCSFEIDDAEDEWIFKHHFDYIHARGLVTCFRDPRQVLCSAFKFLQPGGYLEIQDAIFPPKYGEEPPEGSVFVQWIATVMAQAEKSGRPWTNVQYYAKWMNEIGFIDVVEKRYFLPVGTWSKDEKEKKIGRWHMTNYMEFISGITLKLYAALGWSDEEIQVLIAQVKNELIEGKVKVYNDMVAVWGRKRPSADD